MTEDIKHKFKCKVDDKFSLFKTLYASSNTESEKEEEKLFWITNLIYIKDNLTSFYQTGFLDHENCNAI